ncbi:MAG: hypothetical protein IPG25_15245 [Proteobacteria bacterium]|nr:hypothetical protein [Pseudomonadota bacterium]
MDRNRYTNSLLGLDDYTTADILNTPIERGSVLPFATYADGSIGPAWPDLARSIGGAVKKVATEPIATARALASGAVDSMGRAVTAPARAYRGEMSDDQMIDEAANMAGWLTLGGHMAPKVPLTKDSAIAAYKGMRYRGEPSAIDTLPDFDYGNGFPQIGSGSSYGRVPDSGANAMTDFMYSKSGNDIDLVDAQLRRKLRPEPDVSAPNPLIRNYKNANIYDPPNLPKRSFSDDYPGEIPADDLGRLTHDIDGRPFNADATYVFGRRAVGGHEEAFSAPTISDVNAISERLNGQGLESVARREIGGDSGRFKKTYNLNNDAEYHAYVANDLTPSQVPKVGLHEIGHGIDTFANEIPIDGLSKELGRLYHDLNDSMGRRGKPTKPSLQTNPSTMGYKGDDVPREFMAEAIRAYMQDPNYIKSVAPKTAARIREHVNGNPRFSDLVQFNSNGRNAMMPGVMLQDTSRRGILDEYDEGPIY